MTLLSPKLTADADQYIDEQHKQHERVGRLLFKTFSYKRESGGISAQIRNLQQIVCTTTRFVDIEDFVKNQMGKSGDTSKCWRQIGRDVLQHLQQLRDQAERLSEDPVEQLALRLKLARHWVRAVVSEYLYQVALDQMEERHA